MLPFIFGPVRGFQIRECRGCHLAKTQDFIRASKDPQGDPRLDQRARQVGLPCREPANCLFSNVFKGFEFNVTFLSGSFIPPNADLHTFPMFLQGFRRGTFGVRICWRCVCHSKPSPCHMNVFLWPRPNKTLASK